MKKEAAQSAFHPIPYSSSTYQPENDGMSPRETNWRCTFTDSHCGDIFLGYS
jgi:hypothetical protein